MPGEDPCGDTYRGRVRRAARRGPAIDDDCNGVAEEGCGPSIQCPAAISTPAGTAVSLTVNASAPTGVVGYSWTIVNAPAGGVGTPNQWTPASQDAPTESFLPFIVGVYTVQATVTANGGQTASCTTEVTAVGHGQPPDAGPQPQPRLRQRDRQRAREHARRRRRAQRAVHHRRPQLRPGRRPGGDRRGVLRRRHHPDPGLHVAAAPGHGLGQQHGERLLEGGAGGVHPVRPPRRSVLPRRRVRRRRQLRVRALRAVRRQHPALLRVLELRRPRPPLRQRQHLPGVRRRRAALLRGRHLRRRRALRRRGLRGLRRSRPALLHPGPRLQRRADLRALRRPRPGLRGQICCTDPTRFPFPCFAPNSCTGGVCTACGYDGEPCCDGYACGTGQVCDPGSMSCGPG